MKKLLTNLCLSSLLLLSLTSCSSDDSTSATDTSTPSSTTTNDSSPSDSNAEPNQDGDAPDSDSDILRVGMDLTFPPFSTMADDGSAVGFEPEVALAFGEFIGREVEIVNTDFSMLIAALDTGDLEILIADMSATEERAEKVDFSVPYRYDSTLALVNRDFADENNITDAMSVEDFFALGGNYVGLSGTKGVFYPLNYGIMVTEVTEIGTGLVEVSMGMADVLVASNEVYGFQAADPDNTIVYGGITEQISSNFAVKKGNEELLALANEFIASMYADGGLYEQMAEEWDPIIVEFLQSDDVSLSTIVNPRA